MPPASLGGRDQIRCTFKFTIKVHGFFFLVRRAIIYGAGDIGGLLVLAPYKTDVPVHLASPNDMEIT
jgi:hypothetical protein